MGLEHKIKAILEQELPGAQVEIEWNEDTEKVGGHIIWKGFAGRNCLRRQKRIFHLLRRELSKSEVRDISFIFTYTPTQ